MEKKFKVGIKDGSDIIGVHTKAKIVKNKVAPPFKVAEFDIMYGTGISHAGEIVDAGVSTGVVKKSGAWFYYGETRLGQGRDNVKKLFEDCKDKAIEAENDEFIMPTEPVAPRKSIDIDIAVDD